MGNLCCKPSTRKRNSRTEFVSSRKNRNQQSPESIQHAEPENASNHEPSNEIMNSNENVGGDDRLNPNLFFSNIDSVLQSPGFESIQPTQPEIVSNNEPSIDMTNSNEDVGENEHWNTVSLV